MTLALKVLYVGASVLALIALVLGFYDYTVAPDDQRNLLFDIVLPLGMLIVIVVLYRRRKGELEGSG